jgi:hypothetical protein
VYFIFTGGRVSRCNCEQNEVSCIILWDWRNVSFTFFFICDFILGLNNLEHFVMLMLLHKRPLHLEDMGWLKQLICYNIVSGIRY